MSKTREGLGWVAFTVIVALAWLFMHLYRFYRRLQTILPST